MVPLGCETRFAQSLKCGDNKEKIMNGKRLVPLAVAIAMLSGCTGQTVLLRNNKGELAKCEVSAGSAMLTGVIIRDMTIDGCVSEYEKAGYKRVGN